LSDAEDSDETIGETGVEVLLVLGEDEGDAASLAWGLGSLDADGSSWSFVSVDESLAWEVIDSDTTVGTNNEPVVFGGEKDNVDWGFGINVFKMFSFDQVPDVNVTVSGSRGNDVGVWCEIKSVDLGLVSNKGVHQAHDGVIPDLDGLVPGG